MIENIEQAINNWKVHNYRDEIVATYNHDEYQSILNRLNSERNDTYNQFSTKPHGEGHAHTVYLPLSIVDAITIRYTVTMYDSGLILKSATFWDTVEDRLPHWKWQVIDGDIVRTKRKN